MSASRRRSRAGRWLTLLAVLALAGAAAGAVWLWSHWNTPYRGYAGDGVFVDIPHGSSSAGIARILSESGVVKSRVAFELLCRWKSRPRLQAGEYRFERPMTPLEVFRMIAEGRIYVLTVTIPEGWTSSEVADQLDVGGIAQRDAFLAAAADASLIHEIAPRAKSLEGFLFPATYQFTRKATPQEIVGAMVARFRQVWSRLPKNDALEMTPAEIVTLASLVEREARVEEERPLIAGVYVNRLRKGMALQCDPTVVYALELANKWTGKIGYADLRFSSPYNTYLHRGLPPGPIANPGEASLRAALQPAQTDYLYFVADTQGRHFFSATLEEHNRNVKKYLRLLAQSHNQENAGAAPGQKVNRPGNKP